MIPNSRQNTFEFNFPKTFMPKEISDKYRVYLNRMPGNIVEEPLDFLNYTIQSINFPSFGYESVEQQQYPGRTVHFRDAKPGTTLSQKEMTVTFQLVDGYINYWMMLELIRYYYDFDNRKPYLDDLNIRMLDGEGNSLVTTTLRRVLLKSIGDLSMSFASNVAEFTTFDVTIGYNDIDVRIELD